MGWSWVGHGLAMGWSWVGHGLAMGRPWVGKPGSLHQTEVFMRGTTFGVIADALVMAWRWVGHGLARAMLVMDVWLAVRCIGPWGGHGLLRVRHWLVVG